MNKLASIAFLLTAPLLASADHCSLAFKECGTDHHCFGMREGVRDDGNDIGLAPATICLDIVDDMYVEATVTAAPGYTLVRNNIWVGENVDDAPKHKHTGAHDWLKFPHQYCNFEGQSETTVKFRMDVSNHVATSVNQLRITIYEHVLTLFTSFLFTTVQSHHNAIPNINEAEFTVFLLAHAKIQADGDPEAISVYAHQSGTPQVSLEVESTCTTARSLRGLRSN